MVDCQSMSNPLTSLLNLPSGVGLRLGPRTAQGDFIVEAVFPGSPAEEAGLKPGMEIKELGIPGCPIYLIALTTLGEPAAAAEVAFPISLRHGSFVFNQG